MGLYFHHPACLEHDPRVYMPEHPDTPERLEAIERVLAEHGWSGWEHRAALGTARRGQTKSPRPPSPEKDIYP
jgi:hypothetical protein